MGRVGRTVPLDGTPVRLSAGRSLGLERNLMINSGDGMDRAYGPACRRHEDQRKLIGC